MNKIVVLKAYAIVVGVAPDYYVGNSFLPKTLYTMWKLLLIGINFYAVHQHVGFLKQSLKNNTGSGSGSKKATGFLQVVYTSTPIISYLPLGILRCILVLADWLNWKGYSEKVEGLSFAFKKFQLIHPELLRYKPLSISRNEMFYWATIIVAYTRNMLRAYAIEMNVRGNGRVGWSWTKPSSRPWYKASVTWMKAGFMEMTTLDSFSLFILVICTWIVSSFSFLNFRIEALMKHASHTAKTGDCKLVEISHSAQILLKYYMDLIEFWRSLKYVVGYFLFFNFFVWMVTLNFEAFFALSITRDNMGPYSRLLSLTAQMNVLCILLRFLCIDNAVHGVKIKVITYNTKTI